MSDPFVQVAADGSGKRVRNEAIETTQGVDTSGNAQADRTLYQQAVTLRTSAGIELDDPNELLGEIAAGIKRTNELLELMLGTLSS